jgi:hypothetical protein
MHSKGEKKMKKQITRMSPHQNAKVFAVLMALSSLIFVIPVFLAFSVMPMPADQNGHHAGPPALMFLLFPLAYLVMGYIMTAIGCALYNFVSRYIGGIEFEVSNDNV